MAKQFSDRYDKRKWRWMRVFRYLLPVALILFVVFQFVVGISVVNGNSMNDTLKNGDLVLYSRLQKDVKKGDVVAIAKPSGEYHVKRVVAVSGDIVDVRDGKLYVNGVEETADYVKGYTSRESNTITYPVTVEEGKVFVLGDNRPESIDSRRDRTISLQSITGVILFRFGFFYLNGL